jgi:L-threonylcarbamoyladenylate synthase
VSYRFDCREPAARGNALATAVTALAADGLVVLPTDTGYGLGCDAFSRAGIDGLRAARGGDRAAAPPVLIPRTGTLDGLAADLSGPARELAEAFWPGPLTLVCRAQPTLDWDLGPARGTVAVRVPLHPLALELLDRVGPMAVTGAGPGGGGGGGRGGVCEKGITIRRHLQQGAALHIVYRVQD